MSVCIRIADGFLIEAYPDENGVKLYVDNHLDESLNVEAVMSVTDALMLAEILKRAAAEAEA